MNQTPLFEGRNLRFDYLDIEKDPQVVAGWTYRLDVARRLTDKPAHPLTAFEVKKIFEEWQKDVEKSGNSYCFALRASADGRLIGFLHIAYVAWVHGAAMFKLVLGEPEDWEHYSREALEMTLRYSFDELNLFRVSAHVEEHDEPAQNLYRWAQFFLEVRQRQAVYYNGRYWDRLSFGMLRPEWLTFQNQMLEVA
jgi:RimJ/RimL family protein N-acetyltransferase